MSRAQTKQATQEYQAALAEALKSEEAYSWADAKAAYTKAVALAEGKQLGQDLLTGARQGLQRAGQMEEAAKEFNALLEQGRQLLAGGKFTEATAKLRQAGALAEQKHKNPKMIRAVADQLREVRLTEFGQLVKLGDEKAAAQDWAEGRQSYLAAQKVAQAEPQLPEETKLLAGRLEQLRVKEAEFLFQKQFQPGEQFAAQDQWEDAYRAFESALKAATDSGLDQHQAKARTELLRAAANIVKGYDTEAQAFRTQHDYQKAIDTYAKAKAFAEKSGLASGILDQIASSAGKAQELSAVWAKIGQARKKGEELLAAGKWAEAGESLDPGIMLLQEHQFEDSLVEQVSVLSKGARQMDETARKFDDLMAKAGELEKGAKTDEAVTVYNQAENAVFAAKKDLDAQEAFKAALANMQTQVTSKLEVLVPKVARLEFQKLMDKATASVDKGDWERAKLEYETAQKWAKDAKLGPEADQQVRAKIAHAEKMGQATREFDARMSSGARLQQQKDWDGARSAYGEAVTVAAATPLGADLRRRAESSLAGTFAAQVADLMKSAAELEAQAKWLKANGLYSQAKRIVIASSKDQQVLSQIEARRAAVAPKIGSALVYVRGDFDQEEAKVRQTETAEALGLQPRVEFELARGVNIAFRIIPAVQFNMGSNEGEKGRDKDEGIKGKGKVLVKISKPYYLGETEVTQIQWRSIMGTNPSFYKESGDHPVENVSWYDCQDFLEKLGKAIGRKCRLPTEAEWESACRAGSTTQYWFGDRTPSAKHMRSYMWFSANADMERRKDEMLDPENPIKKWGRSPKVKHSPVGTDIDYRRRSTKTPREPNPFGLHDVHGNVFEWCRDWYDSDYFELISKTDPYLETVEKPKEKSVRSGAGGSNLYWCRSAERASNDPAEGHPDVGLRVLIEIDF